MESKKPNKKIAEKHRALQKAFDDFAIAAVEELSCDGAAVVVMMACTAMMTKFTDCTIKAHKAVAEEIKKEGK